MTIYTVQHLRASNDVNGNPRRLWEICEIDLTRSYEHGGSKISHTTSVAVIDEGYGCSQAGIAMKKAGREGFAYVTLPSVQITPAEYRERLKDAARRNGAVHS